MAAPTITLLTVDNAIDPLHVASQYPWFSWLYYSATSDSLAAFEIRVADNNTNIGTNTFVGNVWAPGKVTQPEAYKVQMTVGGLVGGTRYYCQVRVYGSSDPSTASAWYTGYFELNTPPVVGTLAIIPSVPYNNSELLATYIYYSASKGAESNRTKISWLRMRDSIFFVAVPALSNQKVVPASETLPGDQWQFSVTPHDGIEYGTEQFSTPVTITNLPPVASSLGIVPRNPTTRDELSAAFVLSDPDFKTGENLTGSIRWYKDGLEQQVLRNAARIPASVTSAGEEWQFEVVPNDGYDNGSPVRSPMATIANTPPEITSIAVDSQILPKGVTNATPTFSWSYLDDDSQAQQKYQFVLGTAPIKTDAPSSAGSDLGASGEGDGIIATAGNGTILAGDEIYDTGVVTSTEQSFQYVTEDAPRSLSAPAVAFSTLVGYVLAPDLQSLSLRGSSGTAMMVFSSAPGVAGTYDVELAYTKEDGKSSMYKLVVDGVTAGQFSSLPGIGNATYVFSGVRIEQGSSISISGSALVDGSRAPFQGLKFSSVPVLSIDAADFSVLSGYIKDGTGIKLAGLAGTATVAFSYPSGTYDIEVEYVTETSGTPVVALNVNATLVASWTYVTGAANRSKFVAGVSIDKNDTIKISGTRSGSALARVSRITFRPTESSNVGASLSAGLSYYAAVRAFDGTDWSDWYGTKFAMSGTAWDSVSNAAGWTIEARFQVPVPQATTTTATTATTTGTTP